MNQCQVLVVERLVINIKSIHVTVVMKYSILKNEVDCVQKQYSYIHTYIHI